MKPVNNGGRGPNEPISSYQFGTNPPQPAVGYALNKSSSKSLANVNPNDAVGFDLDEIAASYGQSKGELLTRHHFLCEKKVAECDN